MAQRIQRSRGRVDHRHRQVMAVVAEVLPTASCGMAGLGVSPTHGLKRGVVVNIEPRCSRSSRR